MTLCLIVVATDGFIAIADGRRGGLTSLPGLYEWMSDDETKIVAVPGLPIVAMTAGRASFNKRPNAEILKEVLGELQVPTEDRVLAVAQACRSAFARLDAAHPDPNQVGTTTLVAGYELNEAFEAFRVNVPPKVMNQGTSEEITFDLNPSELKSELPVLVIPAESEAGMDVVTAFDMYFDDIDSDSYGSGGLAAQFRFAGQDLITMRPGLLRLLVRWLEENPEIAAADGVGGRWLAAEVRPGEAAEIGPPLPLGPIGGPSGAGGDP